MKAKATTALLDALPACELIEAGFEYVCDFEGVRIFRKRK